MRNQSIKRMLTIVLTGVVLSACSKEEDVLSTVESEKPTETVTDATVDIVNEDEVEQEPAGSVEESTPTPTEAVIEEEFVAETQAFIPEWIIGADGIRNDELNMIVRKDGVTTEAFISVIYHYTENDLYVRNEIKCMYFDGDLDSYLSSAHKKISERSSLEIKDSDGNVTGTIEYAYSKEDRRNNTVVFVGNGIAIENDLYGYEGDISEYIEDIVGIIEYEDVDSSELAYTANDGLHCPALGIKYTHTPESIGIYASDENMPVKPATVSTSIRKEFDNDGYPEHYYDTTQNANDSVKKRVEEIAERGDGTVYEELLNLKIGGINYTGRGALIGGFEEWIFYSDETDYYIEINTYGGTYETGLSMINAVN